MAEHIWEIIDNNFKKTPTANSLEVMVYFRGAADSGRLLPRRADGMPQGAARPQKGSRHTQGSFL